MDRNPGDAAVRLAMALGRLLPPERRSVHFVWSTEGRVRRMVVASGGKRSACSGARGPAYAEARSPWSDAERRLQLQRDPVK